MNGKWSGTEDRHRQHFHAPKPSREGVCQCISLKCNGTMFVIGDGSKIKCDECGLIIKTPARRLLP